MLSILGALNATEALTELEFPDGRIVCIPTAMLESTQAVDPVQDTPTSEKDPTLVPLIEEQLEITKQTVITGKVRLETSVEAYDVTVDEPLAVGTWKVERVALGHVVQAVPTVREEDLTTIYPVLEERMVLTKELILVEEIRVTRESSERRDPQTFTLRREHVDIRRTDLVQP